MTPRPLIVTGPPGVGKSTVCREIASRFVLAAHVEADTLQRFVVSGGEWPSAGTDASFRQLVVRTRNAATVAANFDGAGIFAIVDEVVASTEQLTVLIELLPSSRIIALSADDDVVLSRDGARHKHTAANYMGVAALIAQVLGDQAEWIDSSALTIDATVDAVLALI